MRDFGEIAFTIWALGQLNYSHIADDIAQNFQNGGTYGETEAYLTSGEGNYFKNFLRQLQVGLRLDHMVAKGMITEIEASLPLEIVNIVISALPVSPSSNTIGVIAEWCSWTGDEAVTTVQPIMNSIRGDLAENKTKNTKGLASSFFSGCIVWCNCSS